jgi:hypothetical protein
MGFACSEGFRSTLSSGTMLAPVPFVLVSNIQGFLIVTPHARRIGTGP